MARARPTWPLLPGASCAVVAPLQADAGGANAPMHKNNAHLICHMHVHRDSKLHSDASVLSSPTSNLHIHRRCISTRCIASDDGLHLLRLLRRRGRLLLCDMEADCPEVLLEVEGDALLEEAHGHGQGGRSSTA